LGTGQHIPWSEVATHGVESYFHEGKTEAGNGPRQGEAAGAAIPR
jgi:hypothetical protein